ATGARRPSRTRPSIVCPGAAAADVTATTNPANMAQRPPLCSRPLELRIRGARVMAGVLGLSLPRVVVLTILLAASRVTAQQTPPPASWQEFLERVAELARSAPRPEPAIGDQSIRGRVVTGRGAPLAGARIRAESTLDFGPGIRRAFADPTYTEPDLARSLQSTARSWFERQSHVREAVTA